jgi:hypothetical protein
VENIAGDPHLVHVRDCADCSAAAWLAVADSHHRLAHPQRGFTALGRLALVVCGMAFVLPAMQTGWVVDDVVTDGVNNRGWRSVIWSQPSLRHGTSGSRPG